ncbi:hypothetical protein WJX77_000864 [Trebouxia sp. C0004]
MQALSRLRLVKELVRADILPAAALHTVESAALRIVSGNGTRCQSFRVNSARYVASCPAIDQSAWLHTDQGHRAPYTAPPIINKREESFAVYLALPTKKSSHLTYIVKKCKELAVTSINRGLVSTAADDFFSSIWSLLDRHTHLHHGIFYAACASAAVHVAEAAQAQDLWCWDQASELVEALCNRLGPHWAQLGGITAGNMLQVLAKCQLQQGPVPPAHLDAATQQVSACCKDLNQQSVSVAAWSCARFYQRSDPTHFHALLKQLEEQALQWQNDEVRLQHAVTIIWSMARSHFLPSTRLLEKLTEVACLQTRCSVPHAAPDIEMLFLGYAWLGYPPPPQAMQALVDCFLEQRLQSHQVSNMAWALAVLGQLKLATFTSLLAHIRHPHLQDIKICRQLHFALEFLRPDIGVGPEYQHWQCVSEQLHMSWPRCPVDKKTGLLHQQVLNVLQDGLQLKCHKDTSIQREHGHDLFSIDILIEEQPGVPHDIAVEVDGPDNFIQSEPDKHRLLGPTAFRNLMLLRQVPCLITIPYYEWVDKGMHVAHTYLQDKLRTEGQCNLPDFVLPE